MLSAARHADAAPPPGAPSITPQDYAKFCEFFYRKTGMMFSDTKAYFVERRLQDRILATRKTTFREYFTMVRFETAGVEMQHLVNAMTVNETYFYREDYQFDALVQHVLPEIAKNRAPGQPIRIWSLPCSTGEEPYSIAMQILENWPQADAYDIQILASDIDSRVIADAKAGIYSDRALHRLSAQLKGKYFTQHAEGFRICDALRQSIDFTVVNVSDAMAMRRFRDIDVIFCRNMLIYFDDVSRREAVETLYDSMRPGGVICLGHSESMSRIQSMLERMGVNIRGDTMRTQNVAAVSVTATLPAFARAGSAIDVQIAAMGDATSLQGGLLLVTSLRGLDGEIYAVAQGPLSVSGFRAQGAAASISRGVTTAARISGGAIVEREVPYTLRTATTLKLALKNPDFTTAFRIAEVINRRFDRVAHVLDPGTIEVAPPAGSTDHVIDLIAGIEELPVEVDLPARVVINESSGTVVMGADVRISPVAIAQGGLTISIAETPIASQPGPFSNGTTEVLPRTQIGVSDGNGRGLGILHNATSLVSLVAGLNAFGVTPRDLITVLQALRTAGALQAEIEVQ